MTMPWETPLLLALDAGLAHSLLEVKQVGAA